jgi:peptidoglycan/xylan/chitin deacetylase (PgdA/CDA1 family)
MNDLLILCYHAVSERWPTEFAVSPRRLDAQLRYFARRGYRAATLSDALRRPGHKTLVVTFDDAFGSVREGALPVLAARGVPGTVFVPTGYVADGEPLRWSSLSQWLGTGFEHELRCMGWEDLRTLAGAGWEIGSHTNTHRELPSLAEDDLDAELRTSRASCEEELQQPCRTLAYPFGAHDSRVIDRVRAAGYEAAVILDNDPAIPPGSLVRRGKPYEPLALLREGVYRRDGWPRLLAKTSPLARRVRASRPLRVALRNH